MKHTWANRVSRSSIVAFAFMTVLWASSAVAQERPPAAAEITGGWIGFPDDGYLVNEGLIGGAGRWYVSRRLSIGPEIAYIQGQNHSHFVLTGNLTCDLRAQPTTGQRRVTPFITVGGGLFQTRESFFGNNFSHSEGAFTVGGGVRTMISDRVSVGVEARMGWEAHVRINALVGIQLP